MRLSNILHWRIWCRQSFGVIPLRKSWGTSTSHPGASKTRVRALTGAICNNSRLGRMPASRQACCALRPCRMHEGIHVSMHVMPGALHMQRSNSMCMRHAPASRMSRACCMAAFAKEAPSTHRARHDDAKAQHFCAAMPVCHKKFLHLMRVASIMRLQESNHVDLEQRLCTRSTIKSFSWPHPAHTARGGFSIPAFLAFLFACTFCTLLSALFSIACCSPKNKNHQAARH